MSQYTDSDLIEILQMLAQELDRTPTANDLQGNEELPSKRTFYIRFGSWSEALLMAGLTPTRYKESAVNALVDRLHTLAEDNVGIPTVKDVKEDNYPVEAYEEVFGTVENALFVSGYDAEANARVDDALFIEDIRNAASVSTTDEELYHLLTFHPKAYEQRFGSIDTALNTAGLASTSASPTTAD